MAVDLTRPHDKGLNGAVAAELRAEKAAQNLTNQDLAERSGIPVVSVQRYLAPKRAIDVEVLEQLAEALGKTATEIVIAAEQRLGRSLPRIDFIYAPDHYRTGVDMPNLHAMTAKENTDLGQQPGRRRADMQELEDQAARDEDAKR